MKTAIKQESIRKTEYRPDEHGGTFTCDLVPALGIGLVSGMFCFRGGRPTLYDRRDVAALRQTHERPPVVFALKEKAFGPE